MTLDLEQEGDEISNKTAATSVVTTNVKYVVIFFSRRYGFKRHLKAQSYACEQCTMCGKACVVIQTHLKMHGHRHVMACEICGRRFNSKDGLRHHLSSHAGEYRLLCSHCGKGFPA